MTVKESQGPGPQDGDEYVESTAEELEKNPGEDKKAPEPPKPAQSASEVDALRREIDALKLSIRNSSAPTNAPAPKEPDEPDWENLLYTDPKEYNRRLRESVKKEIETDLTRKYDRDQSTREFWSAFYHDHEDLKEDDDLVKATLNAHMAELAPMLAKDAGDRLAELTRQRILRYTGGKKSEGKKAVAEGSQPPSEKKKEPEPPKVVTLSDLIRARKAKRLNSKGTAA